MFVHHLYKRSCGTCWYVCMYIYITLGLFVFNWLKQMAVRTCMIAYISVHFLYISQNTVLLSSYCSRCTSTV